MRNLVAIYAYSYMNTGAALLKAVAATTLAALPAGLQPTFMYLVVQQIIFQRQRNSAYRKSMDELIVFSNDDLLDYSDSAARFCTDFFTEFSEIPRPSLYHYSKELCMKKVLKFPSSCYIDFDDSTKHSFNYFLKKNPYGSFCYDLVCDRGGFFFANQYGVGVLKNIAEWFHDCEGEAHTQQKLVGLGFALAFLLLAFFFGMRYFINKVPHISSELNSSLATIERDKLAALRVAKMKYQLRPEATHFLIDPTGDTNDVHRPLLLADEENQLPQTLPPTQAVAKIRAPTGFCYEID